IGARLENCARNSARMPLLAKSKNNVGQVALACRVDDLCGGGALAAHAHVERPVEAKRKAAPSCVELHGRNAQIQHDTIDRAVSGFMRDSVEIGETILGQREAAFRLFDQIGAMCDRTLIAVDGDHLAIGSGKDGARITASPEGTVDIDPAVTDIEKINSGAAEHGNVGGRSASDSHHSRAPCAFRAATWELSSSLSARTFSVAFASSFWKRPGSQI